MMGNPRARASRRVIMSTAAAPSVTCKEDEEECVFVCVVVCSGIVSSLCDLICMGHKEECVGCQCCDVIKACERSRLLRMLQL
jgi:hypothetical protein